MTFTYQVSSNGGRTWRTVAVGLSTDDVDKIREAFADAVAVEGQDYRLMSESPAKPFDIP